MNYSNIQTQFSRCINQEECPPGLNSLILQLETIATPLSISSEELSIALLAPFPHLINAFIGYRRGPSQYPHVLTDTGLVIEGSFKSLYPIIHGRPLPARINVEVIAGEFERQTTYSDYRIRKILPTSWVSIYSLRNRKTAAHYGPISEQTDALYSLVGSIFIGINHLEFIRNFLASPPTQTQIDGLNFETILLESINEILMFPVIPTTVIQFSSDGPTINTSESLSQREAITLIFYAIPFTGFEYSANLIDKLLKISGFTVASLSGQISRLVGIGVLTRLGDKVILTNKGIREAQVIIDRCK